MMKTKHEKWAIFWCDLLSPVIYGDIGKESAHQFLKNLSKQAICFPDGRMGKPSLSTLRRKWKRYRQGGFDGLDRKTRADRGTARTIAEEVLEKAIALKKEQPRRSPEMINAFLQQLYGVRIPRSTLYRHLANAHATRLKLGIVATKVRKRWSRDHTHDLWIGDFAEGPYILEQGDIVPTYLSAFIDCHSRYVVDARYYLRQNLDILIDAMIRAFAVHGAPLALYLDNAKVYHSDGLKAACHRLHIHLFHRPVGDPAPGGLVERFFQTVQDQFEAEVRAGEILDLIQLNQAFSAWLNAFHHQRSHAETGQSPQQRYQTGLTAIRQVDMASALESFMTTVYRTVNKTFSDVVIHNRFYRVDPKFRGDRVAVKLDPFSQWDKVRIYSLQDVFLGTGVLHRRDQSPLISDGTPRGKPRHNALDLLMGQHQHQLDIQTGGIDYRRAITPRPYPFHEFAKTVSQLLGRKGGLTGLDAAELESLKKVYNQSAAINRRMVQRAFENALYPSVLYIIRELKQIIAEEVS
jgi:transposase InsO family protein